MSAPAPELPRRIPGATLTGSEFEQLAPTIEGPPACWECQRHPAAFVLSMTTPTFTGGRITVTRNICKHDIGSVAADLPADVEIAITRLTHQENPHV